MAKYKDECVIYIPTYQRIDKQVTLQRIPKSSGVDEGRVVLVAPKNEVKKLERKWNVPVIAQPDDIKNIAQKRAWIIEQCRYERMFMLDDDLRFCYRPSFGGKKLITVENTHEGANRAWLNVERALEHFAHVGIGARMGAQEKSFRWSINSRCMYVLGYQTRIIQKCKLGSIDTREDMDYTLQLFQRGFRNLVNYRLLVDQQFAKAGGMTEERTVEKSDKDAIRLAKRYPGFVDVIQKAYKQSVPRKEVRVAWRKAFNKEASSKQERELMRRLLNKWDLATTRNLNELL
jgi:hypothetical protein